MNRATKAQIPSKHASGRASSRALVRVGNPGMGQALEATRRSMHGAMMALVFSVLFLSRYPAPAAALAAPQLAMASSLPNPIASPPGFLLAESSRNYLRPVILLETKPSVETPSREEVSPELEDLRSLEPTPGLQSTVFTTLSVSPRRLGLELAQAALEYLGYPYRWGGTSPSGFDCSGFVQYVFGLMGIELPRDLWGMLQLGQPVERGLLQLGDLVFFVNTFEPGLSHVGIYIGGSRFVNANSEQTGVKIDNLSEPFWASRYFAARRIW